MLNFLDSLKLGEAIGQFWPRDCKHSQYDFQTELCSQGNYLLSCHYYGRTLLFEVRAKLPSRLLSHYMKDIDSRGQYQYDNNFVNFFLKV